MNHFFIFMHAYGDLTRAYVYLGMHASFLGMHAGIRVRSLFLAVHARFGHAGRFFTVHGGFLLCMRNFLLGMHACFWVGMRTFWYTCEFLHILWL